LSWRDRAIGIALGLILGIVAVILFVFLGSQETIDDPDIEQGRPPVERRAEPPER
jgi:uncharacterized membrane protein required for colicin V production